MHQSLARLNKTIKPPKQNIKQQEFKKKDYNNFLKVVIWYFFCWKRYKSTHWKWKCPLYQIKLTCKRICPMSCVPIKQSFRSSESRPANLWESKTVFCDPKNCIFPQKTVFYNKKNILRWKKVFLRAERASRARSPFGGVQGPKGPGSTQVLGALWCNLSLIFEHYSKTLTKF